VCVWCVCVEGCGACVVCGVCVCVWVCVCMCGCVCGVYVCGVCVGVCVVYVCLCFLIHLFSLHAPLPYSNTTCIVYRLHVVSLYIIYIYYPTFHILCFNRCPRLLSICIL